MVYLLKSDNCYLCILRYVTIGAVTVLVKFLSRALVIALIDVRYVLYDKLKCMV